MMDQYKYSLDKSSRKFRCPGCGQKRFVRYIDNETKEFLNDTVGRCDRESSCQYHYKPQQYFTDNNISFETKGRFLFPNTKEKETGNTGRLDLLPFEIFDKSVTRHEQCDLFPFLERLFRKRIAKQLCETYFIGANKTGNTAFWQIDIAGRIRQCKVMRYLPDGRRNKETGAIFAGKKILNNQDANLQQCFFGEYSLSFPQNTNTPVAITESEKTAVIASVFFPEFVWLATGGKYGAKWTEANVCKVLNKRKVILFPDLGAYDSWKTKGLLMSVVAGCKVAVSDILEKEASEEDKAKGLDLADYLLRQQDINGLALTDHNYPAIFDYSDKLIVT